MDRFVILEHDHPTLHWDFMLETGQELTTWRLAAFPVPDRPIPCELIAPHRIAYLDYEGPVSQNRGSVIRRAAGTFRILQHPDSPEAAGPDSLVVELSSPQLNGQLSLAPANGIGLAFFSPATSTTL